MKYIKIDKRIASLSNKAAYLYAVLVWLKATGRYITRAYLAKSLNIKSVGLVSKYLKEIESVGLISRTYIEEFGDNYKTHLDVEISPVRSYFLVKKGFIFVRKDSAYKGLILRARVYSFDDTLKFFNNLSSLLCVCERTLRKYIQSYLPFNALFFRSLTKWQREARKEASRLTKSVSECLYIAGCERRAKWALNHKLTDSLYRWVLTGLTKKPVKSVEFYI